MKLTRWIAVAIMMLVLVAMPLAVCAAQPESMQNFSKSFSLYVTETYSTINESPNVETFWEYPVLRAGENYAEGTLTVRNDSNYTANMRLKEITLPYGNESKLSYLNHLHLTVTEGDKVLYDKPYVHVNDADGGLKLIYDAMEPGEEHVYTVKLRCDYRYAGDPEADASNLSWVFSATTQKTMYQQPEGLPGWVWIALAVFGVLILVIGTAMITRATVMRNISK